MQINLSDTQTLALVSLRTDGRTGHTDTQTHWVEEDRFLKILLPNLSSCFSLPPPKCIGELRKNLIKASLKH